MPAPEKRRGTRCILRFIGRALIWVGLVLVTMWASAALYFDFPIHGLRLPLSAIFAIVIVAAVRMTHGNRKGKLICVAGFFVVLTWWLSLKPSNDRPWQPDVAETAWLEINGDHVTILNLRNCDYRAEFDYTPRWETREVDLSQIQAVDVFITYWGSPYIAHPIVSFQ